ncbi:hypothetical protein [Streptomyces sp. NPDC060322]|uniref:hypothetical protein n=1 Tax=Streptomyces sp. NPDC060322 TaxID=3347097 RepID=UPI00366A4999
MLADIADWGGGGFAPLLLDDALRALHSPLPVRTVDMVLCAALGRGYDAGFDGPGFLREIVDVCVERVRQDDPSFVPALPGPSVYGALEGEVLARIEEAAPAVREAVARAPFRSVPDVVPSLERLVSDVDPDLGFRLFLRVMKVYAVSITWSQYEGYVGLGGRFGYHAEVVDDGNLQIPD